MDEISDSVVEVAESVLICVFKENEIDDKKIKYMCGNEAILIQVLNLVCPYLDEMDDRIFNNINMRYRLNSDGSKFVSGGMWMRGRLKKRIDDLNGQNLVLQNEELLYQKRIRRWKMVSTLLGLIATILGILSFFKC